MSIHPFSKALRTMFSSPTILLFTLSALFFTLGQLGRLSLFDRPIFGYVYELSLALMFLSMIISLKHVTIRQVWEVSRSGSIFLIWLILTFIYSSFRYSQSENLIGSLYLGRIVFYWLFYICLSMYMKKYPLMTGWMRGIVWMTAIGIILSSLVQYYLYPDIGNIAYQGWDPHQNRLVGLFFDPPITVTISALFFLHFLWMSLKKRTIFTVGFTLIFLGLIFLTYSRGGYLALLFTLGLYAIRKLKPIHIIALTGIVIIFFLFLPKSANESMNLLRTTSIFTRAHDYGKALKIGKEHPIAGIGYNHIRPEKDRYTDELITEDYNPSHSSASFHSSFLIILVTSGVIGLALYAVWLYKISELNEYARYSVVFLIIISLTDNVLLHPMVLFVWYIFIALYGVTRPSDNVS